MNEIRNVIIIGGGPAGYTAALYAARADLNPLVIEGFSWGGQLMITSDVENYPGFKDGILGPELMQEFRAQAERFGAEFLTDDVTRVDFSEQPFRIYVGNDEYLGQTVVDAARAAAAGLLVASGWAHTPRLFLDQPEHDEAGYLTTQPGTTETNVPGVFAVGDVQDHVYRQAVPAAGSGCMGALDAERFLAALEGHLMTAEAAPRA